jgi:hypothetical protein
MSFAGRVPCAGRTDKLYSREEGQTQCEAANGRLLCWCDLALLFMAIVCQHAATANQ